MFDSIVYGILGLCILWDLGLMLFMVIESAQDVRELESVCHQHSKKEW